MPQNINGFLYTLNKSSQTFTILVDITEININYAFVFFLCYAITLFNFNLEITLKRPVSGLSGINFTAPWYNLSLN